MRVAAALFLLVPVLSFAEPIAQVEADGARVVIHSEKCALKEVANLAKRATWHEKGRVTEGCVGIDPNFGMAVMYFADKTVVVIPAQFFVKVTGV